jgi:hypothetical protein
MLAPEIQSRGCTVKTSLRDGKRGPSTDGTEGPPGTFASPLESQFKSRIVGTPLLFHL